MRRRQRPPRRLLRARRGRTGADGAVIDERIRAVLARLEEEDRAEREAGLPSAQRSRQVARTTGQFLFTFVAPQADCEVLEIGGSRGYSTIWLAAGVRHLRRACSLARARSGEVRSVAAEHRRSWARRHGGSDRGRRFRDAARRSTTCSTSSSSTRRRSSTSRCSARAHEARARRRRDRGQRPLARGHARRVLARASGGPDAGVVTVPLDRGLEVSVLRRARVG